MNSLPSLWIEYVAYMGALALVAWRWERRIGRDAFGLIAAIAGATLTVWGLTETASMPEWGALCVGAVVAAGIFVLLEGATGRLRLSLLEVLFAATAALLAFDGVTQHAPLALGATARKFVPVLLLVVAFAWAWELFSGHYITRLTRRIGREGRWVLSYWRLGWRSDEGFPVAILPLFLPIVGLPLITTGILSATLLKDVALAILLARVTGSRSPAFLLLMVATLGFARLSLGYLAAGTAGPPLVESAAFIAALLWLRTKGFRAVFKEGPGRATD